MVYTIEELRNTISGIAVKHGVDRVDLFGSYSRGQATDHSDVDLLIGKGRIKSLFQLAAFRLDIEDTLNIPVDLVTDTSCDTFFLNMIAKDRVMLYRKT